MSLVDDGQEESLASLAQDVVCITSKGKPVKAKTIGQKNYVDSIRKNTITFGIGPAGTGKTYLAVAMLKRIDTQARGEMENFFQIQVNLKCWVKVKEDWRNREQILQSLGYN